MAVIRLLPESNAMFPLVSIVIPSYNQGEFLEETIRSVVSQTYSNIEILVFDGGSTDQSINIVKKYESKITFWCSEKDGGQTDAINKGFRRSRGILVGWINSDDYLEPTSIEQLVSAYQQHPNAVLFHGKLRVIDSKGKTVEIRTPRAAVTLKGLLNGWDQVAQPGSFYLRRELEAIDYLNDSLEMAMDFDLWVRLLQRGEACYIPSILASYRVHGEAKSKNLKIPRLNENEWILNRYGANWFSLKRLELFLVRLKIYLVRLLTWTWIRS